MTETFAWTAENEALAEKHVAKYPDGRQQSAVMPLLDIAQRQNGGHLTQDIMEFVANYLNMPRIKVQEVATFYTMYRHTPIGKYHLQVCTTTPCWLRGSDDVVAAIKAKLGIGMNETTDDGQFTLSEVECAGACVNAPVVAINDDYFEDVDGASMDALIGKLKAGQALTVGPQIDRQTSAPEGGKTTLTAVQTGGEAS